MTSGEPDEQNEDVGLLMDRWRRLSQEATQTASMANIILSQILGCIQNATRWTATELHENIFRMRAGNEMVYSQLENIVGGDAVRRPHSFSRGVRCD